MKKTILPLILISLILNCAIAMAQDVAAPVPTEPQRIETPETVAPMDVRAEDAAAVIDQMKAGQQSEVAATDTQDGSAATASSSSGSSYTIMLRPPEVVNPTPLFQFRDVTQRKLTGTPALPMSGRSSAVEQYRQSVVKQK